MEYSEIVSMTKEIETKQLEFNGKIINVKQYIPMKDKYDLIKVTLQESLEPDFIYSDFKLSMNFQLCLVFLYSDIDFNIEDLEAKDKIYDNLRTAGLLQDIISLIPKEEYEMLYHFIESEVKNKMEYGTRAGSVIAQIVSELPQKAEDMAKILDNFDKEKYAEVINFAKAANGGREINK